MGDDSLRFVDLLQVLSRHQVEFIVVGGVAAILEGAPVSTFDLDIMHRQTEVNHECLLAAFAELEARYRDPIGRHIIPDADKLEQFRLHRLLTRAGPLDVLTEIAPGSAYADVLEEVISSKEHADRDKDRAVLPVLRRTLELKKRSET